METKKKDEKVSLKGIMCPKALWLYSDSDIIKPARKAPKARDIPSSAVKNATERHIRRMLIKNSSWFFVIAMAWSTLFINHLLPKITTRMIANDFSPIQNISFRILVDSPPMIGVKSNKGTSMRS
jgi:hypothetical protein